MLTHAATVLEVELPDQQDKVRVPTVWSLTVV
jgi:hypothetical protein